jgi:hypothetical protein
MTNPKKELGEYLKKLVRKFSYIKAYYKQLAIISEWEKPERYVAIEKGSFFFFLVNSSFHNTIFLELFKLISKKEDRNIIDWLNKAGENFKLLDLKQINSSGKYESVDSHEFHELIKMHNDELLDIESTIIILQTKRDKFIAHSDKKYFDNPEKLIKDFPLSRDDISNLIDTINNILHKHYNLLFQIDINMSIHSYSNVDSILQYVFAFDKMWHDEELIKTGFRFRDYLID